jgi:hypothetical protein
MLDTQIGRDGEAISGIDVGGSELMQAQIGYDAPMRVRPRGLFGSKPKAFVPLRNENEPQFAMPGDIGTPPPYATPGIGDDVERQRRGTLFGSQARSYGSPGFEAAFAGMGASTQKRAGPYAIQTTSEPINPVEDRYAQGHMDGSLEAGLPSPDEMKKKPGFMDPGGVGQYLAAVLGDALSRQMGYEPYAVARLQAQQQAQQQAAAQAAAEQRKRAEALADYGARKEIDAGYASQNPTSLQQNYQWLKQTNPEAADAYLERMTNNYEYRQGPDGQFYRVDLAQSGAAPPPDTLPPDFDFGGGGGSDATGNFPGFGSGFRDGY